MKKILRIFGITLAGLLGLIALLVVILKLIPDTQYRDWITSAVTSSTGRDFNIDTLELDFGTTLGVAAGGISMTNADWSTRGDMLSVERLEAELKLLPLLAGTADIRAVLNTAQIIAESNEDGETNWDLGSGEVTEAEAEEEPEVSDDEDRGLPIRPLIRELRLENIGLTIARPGSEHRNSQLAHLRILTPEKETSLSLEASANGTPVQLNGNLGNITQALDQLSTPLALEGNVDQNSLKILGDWGPILPEANLDLEIDIKVPSTSAVAALAGLEIGDFGVLELNANLHAADGIMALDDIVTRLDGEQTSTTIDGSVANLFLMDGINLGFQADTEALHKVIDELQIELPVPLPPEVHLSAQLTGGKNGLNLSDINAEIRDQGLSLTATGAVNSLLTARQVEAQFNGTVDSLATLSKYANMALPDLGAVTLSGELASDGKALGLNSLDAGLASDELNLKINGGVRDLLTVTGIDAQADLDIASLSEHHIAELQTFLRTFDVELPIEMLPQSAKLSTQVLGDLEQLGLNAINAQVKDAGIDINLTGSVANVLKPEGVEADLDLSNTSIAAFSKYAGTDLPDLGPLTATARIRSSGETLGLESLQARLEDELLRADLAASIVDLLAVSGISAEIQADTNTLAALSELAQTDLPDTDPLQAQLKLDADNLEQARVKLDARTGGAGISAQSELSLLAAAEDLNLTLSVTAETMSDFNKLAQMEFSDAGPLNLGAEVNIQPRKFTLEDLKLTLAEDQSASGKLMLQLPAEGDEQGITTLHGNLDIPYLDMTPLLPKPEPVPEEGQETAITEENVAAAEAELGEIEEELTATEATTPAVDEGDEAPPTLEPLPPSDRLLSSEPLVYDRLHDYDIDLAINATRFDIGEARLRDVALAVTLQNGLLNVAPLQAIGVESGDLQGTLMLDGSQSTPILDTDITLSQFPMPNLGGALDLHINIDSQGQSVAELMASLNGQVLLVARDGKIPRSLATKFGSGLFSFSGGGDTTDLECAILRMDISDGVVDFDRKLAAQMTEVTWRGGGTIDFNTERIEADIVPKPRKGIPISVGGQLAGLVKLTGTLKEPQIAPDYSDAAIKYGKYSAYVATGGLSLLAEIIANKFKANQDVCGQILDGTVFSDADKAQRKDNPPR